MQFDSKGKKKPYFPPTITKMTPEQARQFIAARVRCSDQEAAHFLESLHRSFLFADGTILDFPGKMFVGAEKGS